MSRLAFERAVRRSSLPPTSRLVALTVATWAGIGDGLIPDRFQPSLSTLEAATGLGRRAVREHLDRLERDGWVVRDRPTAQAARSGARTHYRLTIPTSAAQDPNDDQDDDADQGAEGRGSGTPPGEGVGAQDPQGGGSQPPGWESRDPSGRGSGTPKSSRSSRSSHQSPRQSARDDEQPSIRDQVDAAAEAARDALGRATGRPIRATWARKVALGILDNAGRPVDSPAAYVARAIERERDIGRFLPTPTPSGRGSADAFADTTPTPHISPQEPAQNPPETDPPTWGRPSLTVHQGGAQDYDRPDAHAHAAAIRAALGFDRTGETTA